MHYIERNLNHTIQERLLSNPAVALLGSRQCGKSTLARKIQSIYPQSIYLDLEMPSDLRKISEPELFFNHFKNHLICLDEIQRAPELF
jgi:predicted AAA+ superfamily ATPase